MALPTTVQHLPLESLVRISFYVRNFDPYDNQFHLLSTVDKGFRIAMFMTDPGDTLSRFWREGAIYCALQDLNRVKHLRYLSLISAPSYNILESVLNTINLSNLRVLRLDDDGSILPTVAAAFGSVLKPLGFEEFTLKTASVVDPTTWATLQQIVNELSGCRLCKLELTSDGNVIDYCHLHLNAPFDLLVSVTLAPVFVIDDIANQAPNLRTLTVNANKRCMTQWYPMNHLILEHLEEIFWIGDGWTASLSSLPLHTRDRLKSINVRNHTDNINDNILSLIPAIPHIQRICIRPWVYQDINTNDYPTIPTITEIFKSCQQLTQINCPVTSYDPYGLVDAIKECAALESVSFVTDTDRPDYELAYVREATRTVVSLRVVWDLNRPIRDPEELSEADDEEEE
ncbi:hypothetical protein HDV00_004710 [Rhizophlyctis rosea]|nr:hypothetical protein HDV00_004710 [Rhizophlyctis rosea]